MRIFLKKRNSGFTIIETMVAISVFLVVIIAGMGALLNANLLHNKSGDIRQIMDNLSFTMEDMSRSLRTGYNYECINGDQSAGRGSQSVPTSCANGWGIKFEQQNGDPNNTNDQWSYYISNDGTDQYGKPYGALKKSTQGEALGSYVQLTSPEVRLDPVASRIIVIGAEAPNSNGTGNRQQPIINIRLVGSIVTKAGTTPFSLQTSVSQRALDI